MLDRISNNCTTRASGTISQDRSISLSFVFDLPLRIDDRNPLVNLHAINFRRSFRRPSPSTSHLSARYAQRNESDLNERGPDTLVAYVVDERTYECTYAGIDQIHCVNGETRRREW